jgi:glycerophosphoryl diester phosphodiesterase
MDRLARLDCVALDVNHRQLTPDVVNVAHRGGYRVCCYTPNDPLRVAELAGWGVDTIITDAIDQIPADAFPPAA